MDNFMEGYKPKKGKRATYWMDADTLDKLERLSKQYEISKSKVIKLLIANAKEK